uniref:Uncharacterized protein n=1 Tax=Timema cristinae TaxID=61476 RepID=A0A7R9D8F2_TIMCR|nr:unnamed protein product [Timema cristinae]
MQCNRSTEKHPFIFEHQNNHCLAFSDFSGHLNLTFSPIAQCIMQNVLVQQLLKKIVDSSTNKKKHLINSVTLSYLSCLILCRVP